MLIKLLNWITREWFLAVMLVGTGLYHDDDTLIIMAMMLACTDMILKELRK